MSLIGSGKLQLSTKASFLARWSLFWVLFISLVKLLLDDLLAYSLISLSASAGGSMYGCFLLLVPAIVLILRQSWVDDVLISMVSIHCFHASSFVLLIILRVRLVCFLSFSLSLGVLCFI